MISCLSSYDPKSTENHLPHPTSPWVSVYVLGPPKPLWLILVSWLGPLIPSKLYWQSCTCQSAIKTSHNTLYSTFTNASVSCLSHFRFLVSFAHLQPQRLFSTLTCLSLATVCERLTCVPHYTLTKLHSHVLVIRKGLGTIAHFIQTIFVTRYTVKPVFENKKVKEWIWL